MLKIPFNENNQQQFFKSFDEYGKKYNNINKLSLLKRELRIMTFNVYFWKNRYQSNFDNQFKVIQQINPDILIIQEAVWEDNSEDSRINKIRDLGYNHIIYSQDEILEDNQCYGLLLFSKLKIINSEIINITQKKSIENCSCIYCQISFKNTIFHLFGTHLDVYDNTEEYRIFQLNKIFNKINQIKDNNIILLGDFNLLNKYQIKKQQWNYIVTHDKMRNVETVSKAIDTIINNNFIDSYDILDKEPPSTTCCFDRRIDYIFLKKNYQFEIIDTNVVITNSSDHLPLILDIKQESKL